MHIFGILNVSAFRRFLRLFCVTSLSDFISNFVDLRKIIPTSFKVFENRKPLIAFDRMMAQKSHWHLNRMKQDAIHGLTSILFTLVALTFKWLAPVHLLGILNDVALPILRAMPFGKKPYFVKKINLHLVELQRQACGKSIFSF